MRNAGKSFLARDSMASRQLLNALEDIERRWEKLMSIMKYWKLASSIAAMASETPAALTARGR
jgi:hypothetical protein